MTSSASANISITSQAVFKPLKRIVGAIGQDCPMTIGQLPFQVDGSKTTADPRTMEDFPGWWAFNGLHYDGDEHEWISYNPDAADGGSEEGSTTWPAWVIVELNAKVIDFDMWGCACYGVAAPTNFNVEGSNDGTVWTLLLDRPTEPEWSDGEMRTYTVTHPDMYKFYRFNILENHYPRMKTIDSVVFRGEFPSGGGPKPPITDPTKVVASSYNTEDYTGDKAFDGDPQTLWVSDAHNGHDGRWEWIYVDYDRSFLVDKVSIDASDWTDGGPRDFNIQGSNDAKLWTIIRELTGVTYVVDIPTVVDLEPVEEYRYYKLYNHRTEAMEDVVLINELVYYEVPCTTVIPSINLSGSNKSTTYKGFAKAIEPKGELDFRATIGRAFKQSITIDITSEVLSEASLTKALTIEAGVVKPQSFTSNTVFTETIKCKARVEPYNSLVKCSISLEVKSSFELRLCTTVLECIIAADENRYSNQLIPSDIDPLFRAEEVIFDV